MFLEKLKNCRIAKLMILYRPILLVLDPKIPCVSLWTDRRIASLSPSFTDLFPKEMKVFGGLCRAQS